MDSTIFEKWLRESLEYFIKEAGTRKAVVIMDNAPYHSRKINKIPNKSSTKKTMIEFAEAAQAAQIPYGLRKDEFLNWILDFVAKNPQFGEKKAVENICLEYGVEVK